MLDGDAPPPLPPELAQLFADGGAGRTLPVALPPGRPVRPGLVAHPHAARPAYWLSDAAAPAGLWSRLRAAHRQSGLWPLLLDSWHGDAARPWAVGEALPTSTSEIDRHDAATFLATMWAARAAESLDHDFDDLVPFGHDWPGLAPPGGPMQSPDVVADWYAGLVHDGTARLGLVAADRGADALALSGWLGPFNHAATPPVAAVVRSWEDRFGARVVRVGLDTLDLSVAAPPRSTEHALQVAAEHTAFCPDMVGQNAFDYSEETLAAYAEHIRGEPSWSFWWA